MAFLFKRNNGVYYVVHRDGSRRVWVSTGTRDSGEANKIFESIKPSLQESKVSNLEDLEKAISKYAGVNYRKGTQDVYRAAFKHLIAFLGKRRLRFITAIDVENFKKYLLEHE